VVTDLVSDVVSDVVSVHFMPIHRHEVVAGIPPLADFLRQGLSVR
jgi:hypothetical protein